MENMNKNQILNNLNFGERVAEDESNKLKEYFVSTSTWSNVYNGKIDVIYGPKGSGKSAIYSILERERDSLFDNNTLITSAENPRGNTVFSGLTIDPPTSERDFVRLWKLYFLIITNSILEEWDISDDNIGKIREKLENSGLITPSGKLRAILKSCMDYVKNFGRVESLQPGVDLNEATGLPSGISLKVSFREPNIQEQKAGIISVDSLYEILNDSLTENNIELWILIDRLDVAFSENIELETNALKALFIVYNDLKPFEEIKLKIFLRDDIWKRITKEGFREASHITKTVTIKWNKETLLNLIIYRLLGNKFFVDEYKIDKEEILNDYSKQEDLFYTIFPDQIDPGSKKPKTLDWMISRIKDGLGVVAPREMIHLLNASVTEQINLIEIGDDNLDKDGLFSPGAIKKALNIVSKTRLEQTIYAEFPSLQEKIQMLKGEKAEHTIETLSNIWGMNLTKAAELAYELVAIGFFEEKGSKQNPRFWVPFMYRIELDIIQGSAD